MGREEEMKAKQTRQAWTLKTGREGHQALAWEERPEAKLQPAVLKDKGTSVGDVLETAEAEEMKFGGKK